MEFILFPMWILRWRRQITSEEQLNNVCNASFNFKSMMSDTLPWFSYFLEAWCCFHHEIFFFSKSSFQNWIWHLGYDWLLISRFRVHHHLYAIQLALRDLYVCYHSLTVPRRPVLKEINVVRWRSDSLLMFSIYIFVWPKSALTTEGF